MSTRTEPETSPVHPTKLPGLFVASSEPGSLPPAGPGIRAVDLFRFGEQECAVTVDHAGMLHPHLGDERQALPAWVRSSFNFHKLRGPLREIHARQLWLFNLQGVQPAGRFPGLNDPVDANGLLFGPFPSTSPLVVSGHLASTRGEVLDGLLCGSWHSFHVGDETGEERTVTSLLMAADDVEVTDEGCALVLAYPFLPQSLQVGELGNQHKVCTLLRDMLHAVRTDQLDEGPGNLAELEIPVASRAALEASLEMRGFKIQRDVARRPRRGILGHFFPERVRLPQGGSMHDFLALTRVALLELPGWPTSRSRSVHRRLGLPEVWWTAASPQGIWPVEANAQAKFSIEDGYLVSPPSKGKKSKGGSEDPLNLSWRALHLAVDPSFGDHAGSSVGVEIEFFDDQTPGEISISYNTEDKPDEYIAGQSFRAGGSWVRDRFQLERVDFRNQGPGGTNLRLLIRGYQPVRISRVGLKRVSDPHSGVVSVRGDDKPPSCRDAGELAPAVKDAVEPAATTAEPRRERSPEVEPAAVSLPAEQWSALHHVNLQVSKGRLLIECLGSDPALRVHALSIRGPVEAVLRMKSTGRGAGEIFWATVEHPREFDAVPSKLLVIHDGEWHDYRVRIYELGVIQVIRLDPGEGKGSVEIERFTLEPVLPPALPVAPATGLVVYFDPRYTSAWNSASARLAEKLELQGFTLVDADQLASWMRGRIEAGAPGSVCIMAIDAFPDTIFESFWDDCTARRYLNAGGRIVWGGAMPFAERGFANGERAWTGAYGLNGAIGFNAHAGDVPESPDITHEGRSYGLQITAPNGNHVCNRNDVTVVLAGVGRFYATSWLKTYNTAHPGSGLLRYRNGTVNGASEADIDDIARVACAHLPAPE